MNTTNRCDPCLNQVALDSASNRHVTSDDGRKLDLELYRDYAREQALALRKQAIRERRAFMLAMLREAATSCERWIRQRLAHRAAPGGGVFGR